MIKKICYLTCALVLTVANLTAQSKENQNLDSLNFKVHIFPDPFITGTFSDYNSRFFYIDKETQIDRYYPNEKSLAKYISYFIKRYYKIDNELIFDQNKFAELFVPILAKRLNVEYFNANGHFIYEKLKTDEDKLSYLLGIYYRYGESLDDNIYQIKLVNSPTNKIIYQLLRDLGASRILFKETVDKIPKSYTFYFQATPKMIKYFNTLKQEKAQLAFESISFVDEKNKNSNDFTKQKEKQNKELLKYLNLIFE